MSREAFAARGTKSSALLSRGAEVLLLDESVASHRRQDGQALRCPKRLTHE